MINKRTWKPLGLDSAAVLLSPGLNGPPRPGAGYMHMLTFSADTLAEGVFEISTDQVGIFGPSGEFDARAGLVHLEVEGIPRLQREIGVFRAKTAKIF